MKNEALAADLLGGSSAESPASTGSSTSISPTNGFDMTDRGAGDCETITFGPFQLTLAERLLTKEGEAVVVGGRALDILFALVEHAGRVVTKRDLISHAWPGVVAEETSLRVHITALRKAIGDGRDGARYIANVSGRGYCFVAPVRRARTARHHLPVTSFTGAAPRSKLPPRPHLIGRDEAVEALASLLMSRRFVSIVSPGGMGKTTVALAISHSIAQEFDGAICFVDLGALTDAAHVVPTVASEIGCLIQSGDPVSGLVAFLADKRFCLVLDNCEHVIDAVAALAERLFNETSLVHLLVTSREALRVTGEHVHLLPPLDAPPDDVKASAAEVLTSPAARLFMYRAAAGGHGFELSDVDAPVVAGICRRLDGIALAIAIAAGRIGAFGIGGIANLLDSPFKLRWQGQRNAVPRHRTLQALLDWSYNLLSEHEQRILRSLSVFVGVFSFEAAQSVVEGHDDRAQGTAEAIMNLVDKSLLSLSVVDGSAYYRLLDTTRDYVRAKLVEHGELDVAARRHALHYTNGLANDVVPVANSDIRRESVASLQIGNVRAALVWSFSARGDALIAVELVGRAVPLFLRMSLLDECQHWCVRGLAMVRDGYGGMPQELALQKALAISSMFTRGNTPEVRAALERGLEVASLSGDAGHELHFLAGLNLFLTRRGDFTGALVTAERNAVVAAGYGRTGIVPAEWMLGATHHMVGNQVEALRHCERGFELAASSDAGHVNFFGYDHHVRARVALARTLWLRGFPDQAARTAHRAIGEGAMSDHPVTLCISLLYATYVFFWCGDFRAAEVLLERALVHTSKHSLPAYHAVGSAMKGELLVLGGAWAKGVDVLRTAVSTLLADDHHVVAAAASRALAEGLAHCGKFEEARDIVARAIAQADRFGGTFELPDLLRAQGQILLAAPRPDIGLAEQVLLRSLDTARKQSAPGWELRSSMALARLWAGQGRTDQARDALGAVYRQFTEGFETLDLKTARQLLADLGAPPEEIAEPGRRPPMMAIARSARTPGASEEGEGTAPGLARGPKKLQIRSNLCIL
jgi:predicted ATPase/DNA-binding winged helix-turn-helix (wHTH) protein